MLLVFRGECSSLWSINNIIKDIGMFFSKGDIVNVNYIYSERNRISDWIVNEGQSVICNFS